MKMRPLGCALIQSDGCPYKKKKCGCTKKYKDYSTQRKDHVKTQEEGDHLQVRKPWKKPTLLTTELGLYLLELQENKCLSLKPPGVGFCYDFSRKLIHGA